MGYWKSDYDFSWDIVEAVQRDYDAKLERESIESEIEREQEEREHAQTVEYQRSEISDYLKSGVNSSLKMLTYLRDSYTPPQNITSIVEKLEALRIEFEAISNATNEKLLDKAYQEFCKLPF